MPFRKEPPHSHQTVARTAVLLINLGTPDAPTAAALRPYLKQFLSDPRVVELPRALWQPILRGIVLPFRSGKSAEKYASIWSKDGSPLKIHTEKQATLLRGYLGERGHDVQVAYAMRYGNPGLPQALRRLKEEGCDRILVLPAYPQYSAATTASIFDAVFRHYLDERNVPELRFVKHYHDDEAYLHALACSVRSHWALHGQPEWLVMSFHGMPQRTLLLGDPYFCECQKTARLLAAQLGLPQEQYAVTFQSRFGKAQWLQPYTAPTLEKLAREGVRRVDVLCPGFIGDCLETLEEIAIDARRRFLTAGGKEFHYIPCLNEAPEWIAALAQIAEQHMIGWPTMSTVAERQEQAAAAARSAQRAKEMGAPQ